MLQNQHKKKMQNLTIESVIERQASKLREEGLNMSDNDTESDQC